MTQNLDLLKMPQMVVKNGDLPWYIQSKKSPSTNPRKIPVLQMALSQELALADFSFPPWPEGQLVAGPQRSSHSVVVYVMII